MVELKSTAQAVFNELQKRGVPVEIVSAAEGLMRFEHGGVWHLQRSCSPDTNSSIGGYVSDRKPLTNAVVIKAGVPVPAACVVHSAGPLGEAEALIKQHGKVVVKPSDGAHGWGITVGVTNIDELKKAVTRAMQFTETDKALVQQQVTGDDVRVLIIGGKVVAAGQRVPAQVTGDGRHTLRQLIDDQNVNNPDRGVDYQKKLNKIDVTAAELFLGERIDHEVPATDQIVQTVGTANIGTGGESRDITAEVLAEQRLVTYAQDVAAALGMTVCGVDFLWDSASGDINFLEVNSTPSFGLHLTPSSGDPQPVDKILVDFLLKD